MLALVTDAFGGTGGIAQYNRDLLGAIASHPATKEVTVVPRTIAREFEPMHPRITHLADVTRSKRDYVSAIVRLAMRRPRFNWIVCGHVNLLPLACTASMESGAPVILLTHGIEVWQRNGWLRPQLLTFVRALTSVSDFTHRKMSAWAPPLTARFFLLPNAIDLSKYSPGAPNPALRIRLQIGKGPVILTLGRMDAAERSKGFDEILEVLPELLTELPELVYIAAGEGSDQQRLQDKASSLGLADHARFPGYVPECEKLDYYRLADTFVMPSRGEGFGRVFLEALAAGVPVVASKVDGSREAVRDGRWGTLVILPTATKLWRRYARHCSILAFLREGSSNIFRSAGSRPLSRNARRHRICSVIPLHQGFLSCPMPVFSRKAPASTAR